MSDKAMRSFCSFGAVVLVLCLSMQEVAAQESKQIASGKEVYAQQCTLCHGADGKRGEGFQVPIWGNGSALASKFGNAQTMLDYMQLMPFNDPTLINDVERLAVTAFVLANHGTIPRDGELTIQNAPTVNIK